MDATSISERPYAIWILHFGANNLSSSYNPTEYKVKTCVLCKNNINLFLIPLYCNGYSWERVGGSQISIYVLCGGITTKSLLMDESNRAEYNATSVVLPFRNPKKTNWNKFNKISNKCLISPNFNNIECTIHSLENLNTILTTVLLKSFHGSCKLYKELTLPRLEPRKLFK